MDSNTIKPGTILVVDDQQLNLDLLRRWLEADGHTVIVAEDGEGALAAVTAHRPDLLLLDIMIPAPSGFEVCRRLKGDPATHYIPVVLMSGLQDPSNWKRGLEVGAVDVIHKPLNGDDVRARVLHHLGQARGEG